MRYKPENLKTKRCNFMFHSVGKALGFILRRPTSLWPVYKVKQNYTKVTRSNGGEVVCTANVVNKSDDIFSSIDYHMQHRSDNSIMSIISATHAQPADRRLAHSARQD